MNPLWLSVCLGSSSFQGNWCCIRVHREILRFKIYDLSLKTWKKGNFQSWSLKIEARHGNLFQICTFMWQRSSLEYIRAWHTSEQAWNTLDERQGISLSSFTSYRNMISSGVPWVWCACRQKLTWALVKIVLLLNDAVLYSKSSYRVLLSNFWNLYFGLDFRFSTISERKCLKFC